MVAHRGLYSNWRGTYDNSAVPHNKLRTCLSFATSIAAFLGLSGCVTANAADEESFARQSHPVLEFQNKEDRLYQIGYRLGVSNARYCARRQPTLGLLIHDARAYAAVDKVRSVLGLSGDIGIQSVAKGSSADLAGLKQNDILLAIDGVEIDQFSSSDKPAWYRATALRKLIDQSALDGNVSLTSRSAEGAVLIADISAVDSCASVFELISGDDGAAADGTRVLVGENFPGFAYADDELAAILAHEMAHNLLGHIPFLKKLGNGDGRARNSERDADRLMPWLLANAGYDPEAAVRMMRRYGPRYGGGLLRRRTHDGWDERVVLISEEVEKVRSLSEDTRGVSVDWQMYFEPLLEIE
jgi:hypothetical protein